MNIIDIKTQLQDDWKQNDVKNVTFQQSLEFNTEGKNCKICSLVFTLINNQTYTLMFVLQNEQEVVTFAKTTRYHFYLITKINELKALWTNILNELKLNSNVLNDLMINLKYDVNNYTYATDYLAVKNHYAH